MKKPPALKPPKPARCAICQRPLFQSSGRGRPVKYCSGFCRAVAQGLLTHEDVTGFPEHCPKD